LDGGASLAVGSGVERPLFLPFFGVDGASGITSASALTLAGFARAERRGGIAEGSQSYFGVVVEK